MFSLDFSLGCKSRKHNLKFYGILMQKKCSLVTFLTQIARFLIKN